MTTGVCAEHDSADDYRSEEEAARNESAGAAPRQVPTVLAPLPAT